MLYARAQTGDRAQCSAAEVYPALGLPHNECLGAKRLQLVHARPTPVQWTPKAVVLTSIGKPQDSSNSECLGYRNSPLIISRVNSLILAIGLVPGTVVSNPNTKTYKASRNSYWVLSAGIHQRAR